MEAFTITATQCSVLNIMAHFFTSVKSLEVETKLPVAPKILTKAELALASKDLTYALPGMYTSVKARVKRKGKGKHHVYKFPSPAEADRMNKPFNLIQTAKLARISSSTTIEVDGAFYFTFNDLNQQSQLAAIFDQYRICMIEIKFISTIGQYSGAAGVAGMFFTAVDTDDSSSTTAASIRDYPGCISTEVFKPHTHVFAPHVAIAAYAGAFTSFANETSPWIDVASPSVQHYGVKYAYDVGTAVFNHDVITRVHYQFRNVR